MYITLSLTKKHDNKPYIFREATTVESVSRFFLPLLLDCLKYYNKGMCSDELRVCSPADVVDLVDRFWEAKGDSGLHGGLGGGRRIDEVVKVV